MSTTQHLAVTISTPMSRARSRSNDPGPGAPPTMALTASFYAADAVPTSLAEEPSLRQVFTAGMMPAEFAIVVDYLDEVFALMSAQQLAKVEELAKAYRTTNVTGAAEQPTLFPCATTPSGFPERIAA